MAPTPKAIQRNKKKKRDHELAVSRQANLREMGIIGSNWWVSLRGCGVVNDGSISQCQDTLGASGKSGIVRDDDQGTVMLLMQLP